jgi:hypothetical protein
VGPPHGDNHGCACRAVVSSLVVRPGEDETLACGVMCRSPGGDTVCA